MNIRREIDPIIERMDTEAMDRLYQKDPAQTLRMLQYRVFDVPEILARWQAMDMLAYLSAEHAHKEIGEDQGIFRNIIRRFIWQMCEEGANVPWASPEVVGSIVGAVPGKQFEEFIGPLFFHAGLNEINHAGLFWAVGRLAEHHPDETRRFLPDALHRLDFDDLEIRAYGAIALEKLPMEEARPYLERLLEDDRVQQVYTDGRFHDLKISEAARRALDVLDR